MVQQESRKSLKEVVLSTEDMDSEDNKKFIYKSEDGEFVYRLSWIKTRFKSMKCRAAILQDLTVSEKLGKLDEKYQKLYVASIVHDIRTPLNGIVGMLELLDNSSRTTEEQLYLSVAKRTCKLLLFLTYDITDFSQLEANKFKANNNVMNIKEVLDEVSQLLAFSFERKKLKTYFEASDHAPLQVFIDKNRYTQILLNLLGNAIKFTFKGHIKVFVDYDERNDILLTTVRDTGIGIKKEEIPKLFKLFGKLESSTGVNPQGVGFGLAICKRIAESLGGNISVTSEEGVGSIFTFGIKANIGYFKESRKPLPNEIEDSQRDDRQDTYRKLKVPEGNATALSKSQTSQKEDRTLLHMNSITIACLNCPRSPPNVSKKTCKCTKLLIVDDSECNLFVIQSYLMALGAEKADEALNGKLAVDMILTKAADRCCPAYTLVIMDINMPIMNGIEAMELISKNIKDKKIPDTTVMALSAAQLREDEEKSFKETGFSDYVVKPITKEVFTALLKRHGII